MRNDEKLLALMGKPSPNHQFLPPPPPPTQQNGPIGFDMFNPNSSRPSASGSSFHDVLENLKNEYEKLLRDASHYKGLRDESERKLQAQINEMSSLHNAIKELERKHSSLKQQYEEDIYRLQSSHRSQSNLPRDLGDRKAPSKFPALSKSAIQDTSSGMLPSLGKRRYEEGPMGSGSGSQVLPRLEMLQSNEKDDRNSNPIGRGKMPDAKPNLGSAPIKHPDMGNQLPQLQNMPQSNMQQPAPFRQQPQLQSAQHQPPNPSNSERGEKKFSKDDANFKLTLTQSVQTSLSIDLAKELEHSSVVCCVRFSNDGKYLATGSNKVAQIYSVEDGSPVVTFNDAGADGKDLYLRSVCFSPDARYLACGAEDRTVKLWNIEKREIEHTFYGHQMDIYSVDYSQDGRFIVSGSGDKKARIWDVEKKKCLFVLGSDEVGPKDGVTSVAISPDGRLIAAGSLDRVVRLWDTHTGYFLERYEGHSDSVYSVAFSPDGKLLASGSLDKTLKLWDLSESRSRSQPRSTFSGHSDFVLSVAFSPDGNWLVSGSKDRTVQFWDPRSTVSHAILEGHTNSVISVAVNPANGSFATGSGDLRAKLWRYSTLK